MSPDNAPRRKPAHANEKEHPLGGHELPPEVQDTPEQNTGYDEAAHAGGPPADVLPPIDEEPGSTRLDPATRGKPRG
ncbi:MAG TPA: hypothetical protein VIL35_17530 [Vicinamibacterales bacterium]